MNRLDQLTIKSLKMNRKRTLATILGIILSTALICALSGLVTSMQKTMIEDEKADYGDYYAKFSEVFKENLKYIEENRNVEKFYCMEGLGYSLIPGNKGRKDKPYFYLLALDENALNNSGIKLLEGRMPENENEVVISNMILNDTQEEYKIGETLSLSVSKRESEGFELGQNNPYNNTEDNEDSEEDLAEEKETLVEKFQRDYTIVGIIERPNYNIEGALAPGYSVITKMKEVSLKANVYVKFKNASKTEKYSLEIQEVLKKYQNWEYTPEYNTGLLRWTGSKISDRTRELFYGLGAILIVIIMTSSIFVIRNSFEISVMERRKQYGMLASIGATSKQIHKNVLFEGFILGVIAIPIGILSGIFAVFVLIQIVNRILEDVIDFKILYCIPFIPILSAVVLSIVTIYFSAIFSAKKAAKVSPMEAIRGNEDIKITVKKIKSPKIIKRWFGVGGEIAFKNLKRSRKKYRTTVVSMVVSIVLFLSMYSLIQYGFRYSGAYYKNFDYNLTVALFTDEKQEEYQIYQELSNLEKVKEYSIVRENTKYDVTVNLSELGERIQREMEEENYNSVRCSMIALGEKDYQNFVESLGVKSEEENEVILVENGYHYLGENQETVFGNVYNLKKGDNITAISRESGEELSLNLIAVTEEKPMGIQNRYHDMGFFVISDKLMDQIGYDYFYDMKILAEDPDIVEKEIEEYLEEKITMERYSIYNLAKVAREQNSMVLVIEIFLYGFITVITLIGVTNIFNTITTNMALREKEFAMLRSVGMTQKEFSGMIMLESIFYGFKALLMGIPLGTICSFLIFKVFDANMKMNFILPWNAYITSIVFVLLIVGLTMRYSFIKIKNKNIMETIRKDMA